MLDMINNGALAPNKLISNKISLEASIDMLANFDNLNHLGISVITDFS